MGLEVPPAPHPSSPRAVPHADGAGSGRRRATYPNARVQRVRYHAPGESH